MTTKWVVLKFGGTSVSGLAQWRTIATLLQHRLSAGYHVLLVCSAAAGVTNDLSELVQEPRSEKIIAGVLNRHRHLASELGVTADVWMEQAASMLRCYSSACAEGGGYAAQAQLLSMGEWLSTRIGAIFLQGFVDVSWVDVREALRALDEPELSPARQWLSARCKPGADPDLQKRWQTLSLRA